MSKNKFCWMQLQSTDVQKSKDFYSQLFNWNIKDMGDYQDIALKDDEKTTIGGIFDEDESKSMWFPYVEVKDVKSATNKAKDLGAKIIADCHDWAEGLYSVIEDPTGAWIGIYQSKK